MTRTYRYVGPEAIRASISGDRGQPIQSSRELAAWVFAQKEGAEVIATFVVDDTRTLRVAPRRSEHVECAGGGEVYAAGELQATTDGDVIEVSNQSTGYCPDPSCWAALAAVFEQVGLEHPNSFTTAITFRRCTACGQRNIVKDDWYECDVCGGELPAEWNFD